MAKVEIDNKKMWESILGFQLEGEEAKKFNDLCKYKPFKAALAFFSKAFNKGLKDQGLCYKDGEITTIGPEFKIEKGKWYRCIKDLNPINGSYIGLMPILLDKIFEDGCLYHSLEDNYIRSTNGLSYSYDEVKDHFRPANEEEIAWVNTVQSMGQKDINQETQKTTIEPKQEWSGDSAKIINDCISAIHAADYYSLEDKNRMENWLKSLRPQKPIEGWTMQDEEELQIALDTLVKAGQHSSAKWLKNVCLVPQNHWKPSEEQIDSLIGMIEKCESEWDYDESVGRELLEQLKAL